MSDIPRNWTPTFRLTSIEKPDMSPYLFHLTTRESLKLILQDKLTNKSEGRLKADIPRSAKDSYKIKMVCFTDSPPFALDFFRYRWSQSKNVKDLKYGIGFNKETMVKKGVLPTFYVSEDLLSQILKLTKIFKDDNLLDKLDCLNCNDNKIIEELNELLGDTCKTLSSVEKLMFPLLENNRYQGYIWEREWRYIAPNNLGSSAEVTTSIAFLILMGEGLYRIASLFLQDYHHLDFVFSYDDIRIICCDDEDENIFKEIIGKDCITKNKIQFIRTWQQYDEITDFLARKTQNSNTIDEKIENALAEKKGIEHYLYYLENQPKRIEELKNLKDYLDKEIKRIALIKLCENLLEGKSLPEDLKTKIMTTDDCEIVINSIAAYQEYKKSNLIKSPLVCLRKAITNIPPWKVNSEQELDEIRKQRDEIIKNL